MKKPSTQTLHWIAIAAVLLIVLMLLLSVYRGRRLQSSIKSGRFEATYAAAIDTLQAQTRAVRDKLSANMPGDLEILPEELLSLGRKAKDQLEKQGEATLDNITLRGIYWSDTLPLAEINDRLCKIGDVIEGFTIEKIDPYQITLSDPTGTTQTVSIVKGL